MGYYIVDLYQSPGRQHVASRRFRANGADHAFLEAGRIAGVLIARKRVPRFKFYFHVTAVIVDTGKRFSLGWQRCGRLKEVWR